MKYVLSWRYNGHDYSELHDSYVDALSRLWRLSEQGIKAGLHIKGD